jgi:hypothetical protein
VAALLGRVYIGCRILVGSAVELEVCCITRLDGLVLGSGIQTFDEDLVVTRYQGGPACHLGKDMSSGYVW